MISGDAFFIMQIRARALRANLFQTGRIHLGEPRRPLNARRVLLRPLDTFYEYLTGFCTCARSKSDALCIIFAFAVLVADRLFNALINIKHDTTLIVLAGNVKRFLLHVARLSREI